MSLFKSATEMVVNRELQFDDLSDFWRYAMKDSDARNKASRQNDDSDWAGVRTWPEAKAMAISGWREGLERIERYRAQIAPVITQQVLRPRQVYSMAGHYVDVGSYLANDPECFITREYEQRNYPGRLFKLVCSVSFSAAITPETIIQRGAMVCALVDAIEYAGHRVEVVCNDASTISQAEAYRNGHHKPDGWFEVSVVVKKSQQPLEMTDLAFCLAHPAMLRRMMFSVAEIEGWSDFAHNYGYPAEASDKGDLYIREVFSGTVLDSEAIGWVLQELKKLGVDLVDVESR
ncbi:MAG: hypothetical protein WAT74_15885 [Flavobacteriales bacterium]